jgi:RHS repeat-associated protein
MATRYGRLAGVIALALTLHFVVAAAASAQLSVQPIGQPYPVSLGSNSAIFNWAWSGSTSPTGTFTVECTGIVTSCTFATTGTQTITGVPLPAPGIGGTESVNFTTTSGGAGTVTMKITTTNPSLVDSGYFNVTVPVVKTVTVVASPSTALVTAASQTTTFTVTNTGNVPDTYTFTSSCQGTAVATCGSLSLSSATVPAGQDTTVTLSWTGSSLPSSAGSIGMTASDGAGASATGTEMVNEFVVGLDAIDANPGPSFNRSNCLTVAIVPHVAWECGDLRVTHPLPSVRTYDEVRTPTLIYNWKFASPVMNLGAFLTNSTSDGTLDSVSATLCAVPSNNPGAPSSCEQSATWAGSDWSNGASQTTKRIQLGWAGYNSGTGQYDFYFKVTQFYATTTVQDSAGGTFGFFNLFASPYGAGWNIAGLESLQPQTDRLEWEGGDGSTQVYFPCGTLAWCPKGSPESDSSTYVDGRDSITLNSAETYFTRHAPHGVQVVFNSATGQHVYTIGRIGDTTKFVYNAAGAIDTIYVPTPSGSAKMFYVFTYGSSGTLSQVTAPPGPGGSPRVVTFQTQAGVSGSSSLVRGIIDPDGDSTTFGYDSTSAGGQTRMIWRTDKRGTQTTFAYGYGLQTLGQSITHMGGGPDIIHNFLLPEGWGANVPTAGSPDSIAVRIYGPRWSAYQAGETSDSTGDSTWVWLDRWWQPVRIVDAYGANTFIYRFNSTYPAQITELVDPLGRMKTATYDQRGNPSTITDYGTYVDGQFATTSYQFTGVWDFDTLTVSPLVAADSIHDSYDAFGNHLWHELGRSSHRETFNYNGSCLNLMSSDSLPQTAKDSLLYDASRCNPSAERSPNGNWTTYATDTIGRVLSVLTPIYSQDIQVGSACDTLQGNITCTYPYYPRQEVTHQWDVMDRDSITTTIGPPIQGSSVDQIITVTRAFDAEGNLLSVNRQATPDSAGIGVMHTATVYDRANRATVDTAVNGARTTRSYDPASNVTQILTPRGFTISSVYDRLDRLVSKVVPSLTGQTVDTGIPVDTFVGGGGLGSNVHGDTTGTYNYTPYISRDYGGQTVHGDTVSFTYDLDGRTVEADNVNSHVSRQYYLNGLLQTETQRVRTLPDSGAQGSFIQHIYIVGYHYDLDGRRDTLYYPSQVGIASFNGSIGTAQSYAYNDTTGWLASTTDPSGIVANFTYTARGDLSLLQFPGWNWEQSRVYDGNGNVTSDIVTNIAGDSSERNTALTYDARNKALFSGNTERLHDTLWAAYTGLGYVAVDSSHAYNLQSGAFNSTTEHFRYDPLGNRLYDTTSSTVVQQYGSNGGLTNKDWFYNANTGWLAKYFDAVNNDSGTYLYDASGNTYFDYVSRFNQSGNPLTPQVHDRASFYNAQEQLVEVDYREVDLPTEPIFDLERADEVYRYDALGRRVFINASRTCGPYEALGTNAGYYPDDCRRSFVRRVAFDGQQELVEFQTQDSSVASIAEADVGVVELPVDSSHCCIDNNPYFGQVVYSHALGIDQPITVTRLNYATRIDVFRADSVKPYYIYPPIVQATFWNTYGRHDATLAGTIVNGALVTNACPTVDGESRCPAVSFELGFAAYNQVTLTSPLSTNLGVGWWGSLLDNKTDQTFTLYRRNRIYDPVSGRFTQPDPIGLAGGINDYGFAAGDPVNYSDPFGLCPEYALGNCTQAEQHGPPSADQETIESVSPGVGAAATIAAGPEAGAAADAGEAVAAKATARVIGHYPEYLKVGEELGSKVFSVPERIWQGMSGAERWTANQKFLDRGIAAGADFISTAKQGAIRAGSQLEKEVGYLVSKGYQWVKNGTRLVSPQ